MKSDFGDCKTLCNEISPDTGQDDASCPETQTQEFISNNVDDEKEAKHNRSEYNKVFINKHVIEQLLDKNITCASSLQTPLKKKRRKERESVEHSIVKQNLSSDFQLFDHSKRKTKKMAEMKDFLERERNVSILNDICKSKFGGFRKKCKRNIIPSSGCNRLNFPLSSESVNLDICNTNSIDSPNQPDISHLYPNLRACVDETQVQDISEKNANTCTWSTSQQEELLNSNLNSKETLDRNLDVSEDNDCVKNTMKGEEFTKKKSYDPPLIKNEIEITDNKTCLSTDHESSVLNLLISDVKGSAWIDPDGYTSEENPLVIDESIDTHEACFGDGGNQDLSEHNSKDPGNSSSKRIVDPGMHEDCSLQLPWSKVDIHEQNMEPERKLDSVKVGRLFNMSESQDCNAVHSSSIKIQTSLPTINDIEPLKNINSDENSDCYVIEVEEEAKSCEDSSRHSVHLKDAPIKKIKLKKVDRKEENYICDKQNVGFLSSKRKECVKVKRSNCSSSNSHINDKDIIIDVDNYVETQKEHLNNKDTESNLKCRSNVVYIPCEDSEEIVSSSNVESVDLSNICPVSSSDQYFSHIKHEGKQQTELNVLRKQLKSEDFTPKHAIPRDPRTSKTIEKSQVNYIDNSNDDQTSESQLFFYDTDRLLQKPLGEFTKLIYVVYRELLTPPSQNLIRQLTETLYLVINESITYSDRCRRGKLLISTELVIREKVLAHRDFQANTILYGMYFTHLFKNLVQCFPSTKEFHNFMYLALFVNLSRRLKSIYNVHYSYMHIARKLVVSMLKANDYDDVIIFSAICKPDSVFETDFILVSQLIDSFTELAGNSFPQETNSLFQVSQCNHHLQPTVTPELPSRNILHPEFPPGQQTTGASTLVSPSQSTPKSHLVSLQSKPLTTKGTHFTHHHRILPKSAKLTSSRDPRVYATSSKPEKRNTGKSRQQIFLITKPHTPNTQRTLTECSKTISKTPLCVSNAVPTSVSTSTLAHFPSPDSITFPTSIAITMPRVVSTTTTNNPKCDSNIFNERNSSIRTQFKLPGCNQNQSSNHVRRPTAIRPRLRPYLPYYSSAPLLLNALMIPTLSYRYNCNNYKF